MVDYTTAFTGRKTVQGIPIPTGVGSGGSSGSSGYSGASGAAKWAEQQRQKRIAAAAKKAAATAAATAAAKEAKNTATRTELKRPDLKPLPKKNVYVYESSTGRVFIRENKLGTRDFKPYGLKEGERIEKMTPYSVQYAPGTSNKELERRITETHRGMSIGIGGPAGSVGDDPVNIPVPKRVKAPTTPGGTVVAFAEFIYSGEPLAPFVGPGEYDKAAAQLKGRGTPIVDYFPPDLSAGDIPLAERGVYGVMPITSKIAATEDVVYKGASAKLPFDSISPMIGVPTSGKRKAAAGIAVGAATAPVSLAMLPFTLPAMAADPGKAMDSMISQFQQRPAFSIGKQIGTIAALQGMSIGFGSLAGRAPKYEIEYTYGMGNIVKSTKAASAPGGPIASRAGYNVGFRPGEGLSTYSVEYIKSMQKSPGLDIFKGMSVGRKSAIYQGSEKTAIYSYKVTTRMKAAPVIPEKITFADLGVAYGNIWGSGSRGGQNVLFDYKVQAELSYPIKAPAGAKVTQIIPKGKGPSNPPFTAPNYSPISPGAAARSNLWADWTSKPAASAGSKISTKVTPKTLVSGRQAAIMGFKRVPEAEEYFISPAAASSMGQPGLRMKPPSMEFALGSKTRQNQRMGLSMEPAFSMRKMGLFRVSGRSQRQTSLTGQGIDMREILGFRQRSGMRQAQITSSRQTSSTRQPARASPFKGFEAPTSFNFQLLPPPTERSGYKPKRGKRKGGPKKQRTRYTPSLAAQLFNIRSAGIPRGPFTGAEIRPLPGRRGRKR